ncbi:MAG: hypothetical protein WBW33_22250 [Bryobacteraceae bacterium]
MIFAARKNPDAQTQKWYQRALLYVAFTVVVVAIFIALIASATETGLTLQQRLWQCAGLLLACALVAGGYLTLVRAEDSSNESADGVVPATIVFDAVCFTVGGLVIVTFANSADPRRWAATIVWALACLAIGAIAGFLFGIPRSRREGQPVRSAQSPAPQNQSGSNTSTADGTAGNGKGADSSSTGDNGAKSDEAAASSTTGDQTTAADQEKGSAGEQTADQNAGQTAGQRGGNASVVAGASQASSADLPQTGDPSPIEQISDWLTKIIVGLGLANLKELPAQLDKWAHYVAMSIGGFGDRPNGAPDDTGASLALGLILYFLILGFMACYILTQIFLRNLINRSSTN